MCCGATSQTTNSSSTSNAAPQASAAIDRANTVSQTPYTPYNGTMVAGFTPQQQQAFNQVSSSQGIGTPYLQQAAQYAQQGATPITAQNITDTLNSTGLNQQVAALQNLYNQQNATANSTVTGNAAAQGALGGDRVGVAQALTQQANTLAQAPSLANAYNTAYGQAAALAQGNQQAAANAAYTYGNLGQEAQNQSTTDIQNLLTTGGLQQAQNQAQNNWDYQNNYLNPQAWPYQNAQWYAGILSSLGGLTGSQSSQTTPGPSLFSQLLGAGTALGGAYLASDARVKDNISDPIGVLNDGTPIRSFNYQGSPQTQIGVIAQEAEHTNPGAVATDPNTGLKMVNYGRIGHNSAGLGEGFASGGAVDPDLQRMTTNLGHAVEHVRRAMPQPQGYASGGTIMDPMQLQAPAMSYAAPAATSIIPQAQMGGGSSTQAAPLPQAAAQQQPSYMSGVSSLAQGLGKYMSQPASTVDPGTAANGGWTTTVTPASGLSKVGDWFSSWFADGGAVHDTDLIPHMAAGGGAYLHPTVAQDPIRLESGLGASPVAPPSNGLSFNNAALGVPFDNAGSNVGPDANTPFGNVIKPDREVAEAPLPPNATEYSAPITTGSTEPEVLPWQQSQEQPQQATGEAAAPEKSWYEFGGSPNLGMAMINAGGAMMAGTSPFAGANIGQGISAGARSYVEQQAIARQAQQLQIAAQKQAEIERHNQAIEQIQTTNQPKVGTDMYGQRYWLSGPKAGQTIGGGSDMFATGEGGNLPTGDEMLARLPPQIRAQVKAIGEYDAPVPTGIKGQAISDIVHQVYPDYDQTQYPVAQATKKEFSQAGQTGKSFYSVNMSLRHLHDLWEAYKHLGNTESFGNISNTIGQEWSKATSPEQRFWLNKFEGAKKGISTELDKAMKGTGAPDVTGIEDIKRGFEPMVAPSTMRGTIESAVGLLKGKLDGANRAYQQGTGGKTDMLDKWLDPDAKKIYESFLNPQNDEEGYGRPQGMERGEAGKESRPMTADQIRALPDGPVTLGGKNYIKRGLELVPQ